MYIIRNNDTGKYVARPGSEHSYTAKLEHARTFPTRAIAQTDACGNESVLAVSQVLS